MASPAIAASCPIAALVAQVEAETIGIVTAADKLEAEFREAGLMYDMDINPRQCGFDPENRGGEGGNPQEVLLLASDIAFVGVVVAGDSPRDLLRGQARRQNG